MRSSSSRRWKALAWIAVIALSVTACDSGGDNGSEGEKTSGPVELTLEDHQKPRVELLRKLLPKFEQDMAAKGRQITVKLIEGRPRTGPSRAS